METAKTNELATTRRVADAKSSHHVDRPNPASANKNVIEYLHWSVVIGPDSVVPGSVTHKMPMEDTNDTGYSIAPYLSSANKNVIEYLHWSVVIGPDSVVPGSVTHKMPMEDTNDTGYSIAPYLSREVAPLISAATLSKKHVVSHQCKLNGNY
ncbi:hypothetical protein DYB26_008472 [Aphanomyces astaci]|uniref:Uncharacterized protein n=1 Tax=Aphanomyces astaci TaxID=112090 RepID=A0A3R6XGH3_APHAT|nr:hypothetical protein DYB26_008472 [Aphanomyces astaci]